MYQEKLKRYIWIVDTLARFGRLSRARLDELWSKSPYSVYGEGLPRRTFYDYRQAIGEIFGIEIKYDGSTNEYYIDEFRPQGKTGGSVVDWLLNSVSTNSVLSDSRRIADRIFLEDVPSAREHLDTVMKAVKDMHPIRFDYAPYTRVLASKDVIVEPYFLNLFRQRWYVTGRNTADGKVKTYALDRMLKVTVSDVSFDMPSDFDPAVYTRDAFGVIFSQGPVYEVVLRADSRRAKYLRTLPLHHSQREEIGDGYSLFYYRLRLTPDFISEILSFGNTVTVIAPRELRVMIKTELQAALDNYL